MYMLYMIAMFNIMQSESAIVARVFRFATTQYQEHKKHVCTFLMYKYNINDS